MNINVARLRAVVWVAACVHIIAGSVTVQAEPMPTRAAEPLHVATATPLRFFTLQDHLAALRAAGKIAPAQSAIAMPEADESSVPAAQAIGLRLTSPDAEPATILSSTPFAIPGGDLAARWRGVMARWKQESALVERCASGTCRHAGAKLWLSIRRDLKAMEPGAQLEAVQRRINGAIRYQSDLVAFGVPEHWASPLEVMGRGGDCEDFAIAKYLMLRELGFAMAQMKIVALRDRNSGEFHAILAVRHEGEWHFLDNRMSGVAREADYGFATPLATVDDEGQSMLAVPAAAQPVALRLTML